MDKDMKKLLNQSEQTSLYVKKTFKTLDDFQYRIQKIDKLMLSQLKQSTNHLATLVKQSKLCMKKIEKALAGSKASNSASSAAAAPAVAAKDDITAPLKALLSSMPAVFTSLKEMWKQKIIDPLTAEMKSLGTAIRKSGPDMKKAMKNVGAVLRRMTGSFHSFIHKIKSIYSNKKSNQPWLLSPSQKGLQLVAGTKPLQLQAAKQPLVLTGSKPLQLQSAAPLLLPASKQPQLLPAAKQSSNAATNPLLLPAGPTANKQLLLPPGPAVKAPLLLPAAKQPLLLPAAKQPLQLPPAPTTNSLLLPPGPAVKEQRLLPEAKQPLLLPPAQTNDAAKRMSRLRKVMHKFGQHSGKVFNKLSTIGKHVFSKVAGKGTQAFGMMKSSALSAFNGIKMGAAAAGAAISVIIGVLKKAADLAYGIGKQGIQAAMKTETETIPIQAAIYAKFAGGKQAEQKAKQFTDKLMAYFKERAASSRLSSDDLLSSYKVLAPTLQYDDKQTKAGLELANRLSARTGQNLSNASKEVKAVLSGNADGFAKKYNLTKVLKDFKQLTTVEARIKKLDEAMNTMGASNYAVQLAEGSATEQWEQLKTGFKQGIKDMGMMALKSMKPLLKLFNTMFKSKQMQSFFTAGGKMLADFMKMVTKVVSWIWSKWPQISKVFSTVFESIRPIFSVLGNLLLTSFKNVLPLLSGVVSAIFSIFIAVRPHWEKFKNQLFDGLEQLRPHFMLLGHVIRTIGSIVGAVLPIVMDIFGTVFGFAARIIGRLAQTINRLVTKVVMPLVPVIGKVLSAVWKVISPILKGALTAFTWLFDKILWVVDGIIDFLGLVASAGGNIISKVIDYFTGESDSDNSKSNGQEQIKRHKDYIDKVKQNTEERLLANDTGLLDSKKFKDIFAQLELENSKSQPTYNSGTGFPSWASWMDPKYTNRGSGEGATYANGSNFPAFSAGAENKEVNIEIPKLADSIIIREEADIDRIAEKLVSKMSEAGLSFA
ncbi:phage tail protein [Longirhabdus pacifica]|uniref:phage tail protein n=1 Tax=Longirhabdus pacifica TaxID=2305227 RepID=UPI001008C5C5|nr:hypothetical protein [Longirhabdus pacifica]